MTLGLLGLVVAGCVRIPAAVQAEFAPAGPDDHSYFRRRLDAPDPQEFAASPNEIRFEGDASVAGEAGAQDERR